MDMNGIELDAETLERMRLGAFQLFEEGEFESVLDLTEGLGALGKGSPDLWLLCALCLNELGLEAEAQKVFCRAEDALQTSGANAVVIDAALEQCRRFMPSGKDSRQKRDELAAAAARWQPRLKKEHR